MQIRDLLRYSSGLPDRQPEGVDTDDVDADVELHGGDERSDFPTRLVGGRVLRPRLPPTWAGSLISRPSPARDLDAFAKSTMFDPLGVTDTTFNPGTLPSSPAAQQQAPGSFNLRPGSCTTLVQDDQDWKVGGIVGCDGAFATARDVATFSQIILNGSSPGHARVLHPPLLVASMVADRTPQVTHTRDRPRPDDEPHLRRRRATASSLWTHRFSRGGIHLAAGSYGKSGGAGTFMSIDPHRDLITAPADEPRPSRPVRQARLEPADRRRRGGQELRPTASVDAVIDAVSAGWPSRSASGRSSWRAAARVYLLAEPAGPPAGIHPVDLHGSTSTARGAELAERPSAARRDRRRHRRRSAARERLPRRGRGFELHPTPAICRSSRSSSTSCGAGTRPRRSACASRECRAERTWPATSPSGSAAISSRSSVRSPVSAPGTGRRGATRLGARVPRRGQSAQPVQRRRARAGGTTFRGGGALGAGKRFRGRPCDAVGGALTVQPSAQTAGPRIVIVWMRSTEAAAP